MKKIITMIIILAIVIVLIITTILFVLKSKETSSVDDVFRIDEIEEGNTKNPNLHTEESRNRFYVVKTCINKFYDAYQKLNPENLDINMEFFEGEADLNRITKQYADEVFSMLDEEYINYANLTIDSVPEKLGKAEKFTTNIDKVYTKDLENNEYICFVEGRMQKINAKQEKFRMIIRLGSNNKFKILLQDYMENKGYTDFTKDIDVSNLTKTNITDEKYNSFKSESVSVKDYVKDLFNHYKGIVANDENQAYQMLNEEYRTKRFANLDEYVAYKNENKKSLLISKIENYSENIKSDYTKYTCKDNYGNYYIFKETAPFQYTVQLDTYSIPTEEFIETYNNSSDVEKVALNIKRFFMGIDDKNYGYSYSVLSEGFKENKYPTKEEFIKYVKENLFEKNELQFTTCEKENDTFIYKIKVTDANKVSQEVKTLNMIMRLKSGTEYEMSFGTN